MCGIAGLLYKSSARSGPLGAQILQMLDILGSRGVDGTGVALYGREYLVAIQPRDNGLVMYTLRHASEVRAMSAIDELKTVPAKIKPDEIKLARQVIGNFDEIAGCKAGVVGDGNRMHPRQQVLERLEHPRGVLGGEAGENPVQRPVVVYHWPNDRR